MRSTEDVNSVTTFRQDADDAPQSPGSKQMQFGILAPLKNTSDFYYRAKRNDFRGTTPVSDLQCVQDLIRIGKAADSHGFDMLWLPEQHGSAAGMASAPLALLLSLATQTDSINFGVAFGASLLAAPLQTAEWLATTDLLLGDRRLEVAALTTLPPHELSTDDADSEERLHEAIELVEKLVTQEWTTFEGRFYRLPEVSVRPRPSRFSAPGFVKLWGAGTPNLDRQRIFTPFDDFSKTLEHSAASALVTPVFCSESDAEVKKAKAWWSQEFDSDLWYTGIRSHPFTRDIPIAESAQKTSLAISERFKTAETLVIAGGPAECTDKIEALIDGRNCAEIIFHLHFGLMPVHAAEESLAALSRSVIPALKGAAEGG